MGSLDTSSCLFCDESVTKSPEAFNGHVLSHNIKSNQGIFQYVSFLLEEAEKEQIIYNLTSKHSDLNSVSQISNEESEVASDVDNTNEEEDLTNIQAQLEYDSDSDEDAEEEARRTEAVDKDLRLEILFYWEIVMTNLAVTQHFLKMLSTWWLSRRKMLMLSRNLMNLTQILLRKIWQLRKTTTMMTVLLHLLQLLRQMRIIYQ